MAVTLRTPEPQRLKEQKDILLNPLSSFFNVQSNVAKMLPIIQGKARISLRLLDWFVTNYAKKYNIVLENPDRFIVYSSYRAQLKAYCKKKFDPFCRRERIKFTAGQTEITTTVGQLNFFKWAIENKVIDYIILNLDTIEQDMKNSTETAKLSIETGTRKKRTELSISATKNVTKQFVSVIVTFD